MFGLSCGRHLKELCYTFELGINIGTYLLNTYLTLKNCNLETAGSLVST